MIRAVAAVSVMSIVLAPLWGIKPGTGETAARGEAAESPASTRAAVVSADSPDSEAGTTLLRRGSGPPRDYWVREFRRRWKAERADGQARARTIRRLRRTLMARAWQPTVGGVWMALASCESGRRWDYNGSSGFDGGLQFHPGTWSAYRRHSEPAYAYQASPDVQVAVARRVLAVQGWEAWPTCSRELGLR